MAIKSGYTAEDLAKLGPDALTRKRLLAEALLNDSMKQRRIEHPLQGLSQLAETLVGGLEARKLDRAQMAGQQSGDDAWASAFGGGSSPSTIPMPAVSSEMSATSPGGDAQAYRDAIASIESAGSGDYSAVGPTHPKLGRALGRYQVMEANIGPWSREALGREVTPDEFLSNPQIQDAIFDNRFGGYVKQYGPEGAAQAWFGGPGGVGKTDRKDVLGTSVGEYGKRFSNAVGRELASLDPSAGMTAQSAPPLPAPVNVATPPSPPMQVADNSRLGNALVGNSGPSREQLMGILSNPWVSDERKRIAQTLLGQQSDRQNILLRQQLEQQDPAYQLGLQKTRAEIDRMKQPGFRTLTAEEKTQAGIPEWDTRPYQMSREGQITAIGGAGQQVNPGVEASQRAALAQQYGIDPQSAEGQRFILTGTLPASDRGVTAGDREAIREADDMVFTGENTVTLLDKALALSDKAYEGVGAGIRGVIGSQFGSEAALATRELDNLVTEQALGQLKSIFGGAPTEGERAILLDIQGSSNQPASVRKNILERAKKAVERRIAFNKDRAAELRGGTYYRQKKDEDAPASAPASEKKRLKFNLETGELE